MYNIYFKIFLDHASTSQQSTTAKRPKNVLPTQASSIMIFVKDVSEKAFTPWHLDQTDIISLKKAFQAQYQRNDIGDLFLIKKGNLVNLDDRMVTRYFHDEDSFWMKVCIIWNISKINSPYKKIICKILVISHQTIY